MFVLIGAVAYIWLTRAEKRFTEQPRLDSGPFYRRPFTLRSWLWFEEDQNIERQNRRIGSSLCLLLRL